MKTVKIFQHFGHTEQFKLYDSGGRTRSLREEVVDTNGSGHGALAGFLMQRGVDTLICGGIGGGAQNGTGGGRYQALRRRQRRSGRGGERPAGKRACIRSQRPL